MTKLTKEERAHVFYCARPGSSTPSEFAIAEQDRREGPLVEALRAIQAANCPSPAITLQQVRLLAAVALRDWEALDAKPEPTLLEAARNAVREQTLTSLGALKAAVEREERCAGEGKR